MELDARTAGASNLKWRIPCDRPAHCAGRPAVTPINLLYNAVATPGALEAGNRACLQAEGTTFDEDEQADGDQDHR